MRRAVLAAVLVPALTVGPAAPPAVRAHGNLIACPAPGSDRQQ